MSNIDGIDILRDAKNARQSSYDGTGADGGFRVIPPAVLTRRAGGGYTRRRGQDPNHEANET